MSRPSTTEDAPAAARRGMAGLWRTIPDARKGAICIVLVTFCFSGMEACAKVLSETNHPFFVVWARYIGQALATVLILAPRLRSVARTERLWLQIVRSALLFVATIMFFTGFSLLQLAEVTALAQVSPLIITALAALVLGEKVGPLRWSGVAFGFLGALVILRPGFDGVGWAALFPLAGALSFALYSIATRFLGSEDSAWTTFFYTGSVGALAASLVVPLVWATPALSDAPLLALISAFGAAGQALLIFALLYAPAATIAPFLYFGLIWATVLGYLIYGDTPDGFTVLGAAMIVAAGLFVRYRERLRARRSEAKADGAGAIPAPAPPRLSAKEL